MLYFGSELLLRRETLRAKYLDHEIKYAEKRGDPLDHVMASTFLGEAFDEVLEVGVRLEALFTPEIQARAFGETGVDGDPERLAHLAARTVGIYESLLDWVARIRSARAPEDMNRVFEIAARLMDVSLENMHRFVDEFVSAAENARAEYDAGVEHIRLKLRLEWDIDETLSAELSAELERLRPRRKRWFDR